MAIQGWQSGKPGFRGLLVTDLDGTLLNDAGRIGDADLAALAGLRASGYCTAIATGRSGYSFHRLMSEIGYVAAENNLPVDYLILSTGAAIVEHSAGRLLRSSVLAAAEVVTIGRYLEQAGFDYMVHRPVPVNEHFHYRRRNVANPDFQRRLDLAGNLAVPLEPMRLDNFGMATQFICIVQPEEGHAAAERLQADLQRFSVIKATSPIDHRSIWVEIFPREVSKSQSSQWLARYLGLDRQQVAAVGNDYNDVDLLHWAGQPFVVANSPPALSRVFPVVASNSMGGVAEAIALWRGR
jgi:HAD superfamily hydrolase (TIGR01484 family)